MNTNEWNKEDYRIEIGTTEKHVFNNGTGYYFSVPQTWTDEQIKLCLEIAVTAHNEGFACGKAAKEREMRSVLGLNS